MVASFVTCGRSNTTYRNGEVSQDLTYTTKNDEYINRDSTSMRSLNVTVCAVSHDQVTFMSVDIVASHCG